MGTITTLRPSATSSGVGWSAVPSGTLHGVTSDDSDATYALWSGSGSALILATPADEPPVGERRHQARLRMRGEDGDAWGAVRLASGGLAAGVSAPFSSSPGTVTGSWGFGVPAEGSTVLSAYVTGQTSGVRLQEIYLDVDSRFAPTFTAQVVDGSGVVTTTVSDTAQPTIRASVVDTDGLISRQYRYWVTLGADIVWDTGIVPGPTADQQTTALDNGTYTAHLQVWSTLGSNTAYASDEETVEFTVSVGAIPAPENPVVSQVVDTPFYELQVCAPYAGDFDGSQAYIEIQRVDCASSDSPAPVSVVILGPLETDECTTYVDYWLPRTGVGATCTHQPEQCCSYYRARTLGRIDGALQISDWSDAYDPGIPNGMVFLWPSTAASVPDGWSRVTDLDSRYPKGVATSATQPGTTGGAASHTHSGTAHTHDTSHLHTTTGATSAAVGTVSTINNGAGNAGVLATHTHTTPSTAAPTVVSASTEPTIGVVDNDPARLEVVFIASNGQPLGVPDGALAFSPDTSLSGWTDYADADGRFIKGAAPAGNGGATGASSIDNHTHSIGAHTHAGTSHGHTSSNTGTATSTINLVAGPNAITWTVTHSHPISIGNASTAALDSGGSGTSGATSLGSNEPPFTNIRVKENTSGDVSLPIGLIGIWRGSLGSIPDNWALCDGTGGTPDLIGRYPKGATSSIGTQGGSSDPHTHTSPSHTHTTAGHAHTMTVGVQNGGTTNVSATAGVSLANATHTHTHGNTDSTTPSVTSSTSGTLASTVSEPPFEEVAFIQMMEEASPPPVPDEFCLTWDPDYHLIRTEGPDGPMWSQVGGLITWDRERPFTAAMGVMGSRFVTSSPPGGRNLQLTTAVESEAELNQLKAVLARPLVLISPSDSSEVWAAPVASSVRVIKIGRIRQVTVDFTATGPQPSPQLADVGS
jgi:hypothetical protein